MRVGLVANNSLAYVEAAFDLLKQEHVLVVLRSASDEQRIRDAKVERVLGSPDGGGWLKLPGLHNRSDTTAQVMFTSGTEGEPKGVQISHRNLADVIDRLEEEMGLDSAIREYIGVPVYHSFGFGRCRAVAAAGGTFFIPEEGFRPAEIASMLRNSEINAISAVPSLWRVLLSARVITPELGAGVRWIEIGSQWMSVEEKQEMCRLFPKAAIVQHYGLTEASRSTLLRIDRAPATALDSVGCTRGEVEIRIQADGRIALRGPHVAKEYLIDGVSKAALDADGWFVTKDLGKIEDGYLYYRGRSDDVINCGGLKLSPELIENSIMKTLNCGQQLAVCRISDSLRGEGVGVAVLKDCSLKDDAILEATAAAVATLGVQARSAIKVQRVDELPLTASHKVQRSKLTELWPTTTVTRSTAASSQSGSARNVAQIFGEFLGVPEPGSTDTFVSLGGDSLAFIQTSVALEELFGRLPEDWEQKTVAELESLPRQASRSGQVVEPLIWLRGLAIAAIASNSAHLFGEFKLPGGAYLLLALAGASFARFQLQALLQGGSAARLLASLPKLIAPVLALLAFEQLRARTFDWSQLVFVSNLISPERGGFWFINVWIQIYVTAFLAFRFLPLAKLLTTYPKRSVATVFGASVVLAAGAPLVWDTDYLYNRVPQALLWIFVLGWCVQSHGRIWRWPLTLVVGTLPFALMGWGGGAIWVSGGVMALLWLRPWTLPGLLSKALTSVSAASLYIYITRGYFVSITAKLLGPGAAVVGFLSSLLGGIALQLLADRFFAYAWRVLPTRVRPSSTSHKSERQRP